MVDVCCEQEDMSMHENPNIRCNQTRKSLNQCIYENVFKIQELK